MSKLALITGASSGIGAALARYHASLGGDLIIVARRKDALETLKQQLQSDYGINVSVIAQDLGSAKAAQKLYEKVTKSGAQVDILINNAGFGGHGKLTERDLSQDLAMVDLNVSTLVALSHLFGRDMLKRGHGRMLQVGSTAGFMPGPYQAVYFATKAFVNSFSQAINQEFAGSGVTSTVLCPGYVKTEFAAAANLKGTQLVKSGGKSAQSCAKIGYDAMMQGKLVCFNEASLGFMLQWITPLLPRRTVLKMVERMQRK